MKKMVFILALALTFTACKGKPTIIISGDVQSQANTPVSNTELVLLSGFDGEGYYSVAVTTGATSLPYIAYLDVASATQVPLCSEPSCKHNTLDCTAIFSTNGDIYIYNDSLIYMSSGSSTGYADIEHGMLFENSSIIIADKTGRNRKTICTLKESIQESYYSAPAIMGDNILFFTSSEAGINVNSVNMQNGKVEKISTLSYHTEILGTYKNNLVVYSYEHDDNNSIAYKVSLLNVCDGSTKSVYEYTQVLQPDNNSSKNFKYYNGKVYLLSSNTLKGTDILNEIDCATGESIVVCDDIVNASASSQTIYRIFNESIIIDSPQNGEDKSLPIYRRFTINLSTKEKSEITLVTNEPTKAIIIPINIIAEIGDNLLVLYKLETVQRTVTNKDGVPYAINTTADIYAIISKADYLTSTQSFRAIKATEP